MWFHQSMNCCITVCTEASTLFIVEPWHFLSAAARHLSLARARLATGSTAGQEACNYSTLQRCQSVKGGIHAFILASPHPLPLFLASSPFHLPPHSPQPPYPSSSFPTNPQACLDEWLRRETSGNQAWFGTRGYWYTVYWNISLHSFPLN